MPTQKAVHHLRRSCCHVCPCRGDVSEALYSIVLKLCCINEFSIVVFTFMQLKYCMFLKKIVHWKQNCKMDTLQCFWKIRLYYIFCCIPLEKSLHTKFCFAQRSILTEVAFHLAAVWCKYTFFKWQIRNNLRVYSSSVFSLYLVGLNRLISQSFLHSFVAQIASSIVVFVSITCLHLLVSLLNGYVYAAFDSTKLVCGFLFRAGVVYMCAPVCTAVEGCSTTIRDIPFLGFLPFSRWALFECFSLFWRMEGKGSLLEKGNLSCPLASLPTWL